MKSQPATYFYKMDDANISELLCKVEKLKIGHSYEQVISMLGAPTYDQELFPKRAGASRIARILRYYTQRLDADFVNEIHDAGMIIELDEHDMVAAVRYDNLQQRCSRPRE